MYPTAFAESRRMAYSASMKRKTRVAILFGGKSAEHEISLISAKNIAEALVKKKYEVVAIGIDKSGRWLSPARS